MDIHGLTQAVFKRLFVEIEASGRHVHVTGQQAKLLFGHALTPARPLSQHGQFLAKERVMVAGPKGEFHEVAVLGPEREEAQVEVSATDARFLGIDAPVRLSGNVKGTPGCRLIGPMGAVTLSQGVIVAQRHIHMTPEDAARFSVSDNQTVKLQTLTDRGVIFEDTVVRVSPKFATFVHLDYDEANACGLQKGDFGRILP